MAKARWWLPLGAVGAVLLYLGYKNGRLGRVVNNLRTFSAPTSTLYDRFAVPPLEGLYQRVASEVAAALPQGNVLEVGSGPGRLAIALLQAAPGLRLTTVDLSPGMVERARARAADAGMDGRVEIKLGDVTDLPFPDGEFDGVVSTLSLHHWSDPIQGLAEVHRVLAPGGQAWIYDLPRWLWRLSYGGPQLSDLVKSSPFGGGSIEPVRLPLGVPILSRVYLRKRKDSV